MKLALLILGKDLRRYWPLAVLAALFIVLGTMAPFWGINLNTGYTEFDSIFQAFGTWVIVFILVVAVVQEDRTVGDKAFWRTRPISPGGLLAGKLLFFALLLAVPAVAANIFLAVKLDTPTSVGVGIAVETTGFMLLAVLAAGLLAAMTSTLLQAGVAALACAGVVVLVPTIIGILLPELRLTLPWTPNVQFPGSRIMVACLYAMAMLVALLAYQFITRRTLRTALLLTLALPLVLLAAGQWNIDLIAPPAFRVYPDRPLEPTGNLRVGLEPPASFNGTSWVWDETSSREQPRSILTIHADLRDAPPGRLFDLQSVQSSVRLTDGREIAFPSQRQFNGVWGAGGWEAAVARSLGMEFGPTVERQRNVNLMPLTSAEVAAFAGQRGRLAATFTIGESTFHEVVRLPVRLGATANHPGKLWRLDGVRLNRDGVVDLALRYFRATSMLAPFGDARPDNMDTDSLATGPSAYVLLNKKRGEYSFGGPSILGLSQGILVSEYGSLQYSVIRRAGSAVKGARIDEAWMAGAELVILKSELLGKTDKVVILDNFEFPQPVPTEDPIFR